MGEEQWARPGRNCEEVLLLKELTYMMFELTRTPGATFDNDAKACYDRIVMVLAALRSNQLGIPEEANKMLTSFLDEAKYYIKTMVGSSEESYTSTPTRPLHGPGQGGRASPSIWAILSVMIMKLMRIKSRGVQFCDPRRRRTTGRVSDGFVDDATNWVNRFLASLTGEVHIDTIVADMKKSAQWWEELLTATGGKLELDKCFYYIIRWAFDRETGKPNIVLTKAGDISITDHTSNSVEEIRQFENNKTHRTLGAWVNPARDPTDALKELRKKVEELTKVIRSNSMTKKSAHTLHYAIYKTSLKYGAHVRIIPEKDLNQLQWPAVSGILSAMGYNPNMPRAIRHGPTELGGAGIYDMCTAQGAAKAKSVVESIRVNRSPGEMMRIALDWAQHLAGTSKPILEDSRELKHFTEPWLSDSTKILTQFTFCDTS